MLTKHSGPPKFQHKCFGMLLISLKTLFKTLVAKELPLFLSQKCVEAPAENRAPFVKGTVQGKQRDRDVKWFAHSHATGQW